jgi:hypothetical protein
MAGPMGQPLFLSKMLPYRHLEKSSLFYRASHRLTLACVKTPQSEKRRECFFLNRPNSNTLTKPRVAGCHSKIHLCYGYEPSLISIRIDRVGGRHPSAPKGMHPALSSVRFSRQPQLMRFEIFGEAGGDQKIPPIFPCKRDRASELVQFSVA